MSGIEILAIAMYGEAAILRDMMAATAVGNVFLNRMGVFGESFEEVAEGFHAVQCTPLASVPEDYLLRASALVGDWVEGDDQDVTHGSLFILSWQDLKRLYGDGAFRVSMTAQWMSNNRVIDGEYYRLYAFKEWPRAQEPQYLLMEVIQ